MRAPLHDELLLSHLPAENEEQHNACEEQGEKHTEDDVGYDNTTSQQDASGELPGKGEGGNKGDDAMDEEDSSSASERHADDHSDFSDKSDAHQVDDEEDTPDLYLPLSLLPETWYHTLSMFTAEGITVKIGWAKDTPYTKGMFKRPFESWMDCSVHEPHINLDTSGDESAKIVIKKPGSLY